MTSTAETVGVTVPPPKDRTWRRPLRVVLIGAPALWLVFVLAHLLVSGRVWWWRPADLLPPFLFPAVPILLTLAAWPCRRSRRPAAVLSLAGLAAGLSLAGLNVGAPLTAAPPAPAGALRVVSWNTQYWHEPGLAADFYALLTRQRADVYLLQEYLRYPGDSPLRIDELAELRARLPGYHIAVAGELITLSRYPITARYGLDAPGADPPPGAAFPEFWRYKTLRTDLRVGDRVLSVYNVHLPTPLWIGGGGPLSAAFWDTIRNLHEERGPQLAALNRDLAANGNAKLVAGDMNTTPAMGERHAFAGGLRDAADAGDTPYPATWPVNGVYFPTWWRLDWALVSPEVTTHRYELRDPAGQSDHRLQYLVVSL
ncbi:endonuclease/exonuclease/phosphatase family protein [Nonomuraea typhae]|uniref:endonuclease/exonuclease/phosphatase family protein n=1 Tax=Nonomuraea typhae TaxID=2603600 RepID=UPI0012FAE382|nr:endonuclease/exonuclease/phosphatase family protein [Nonomuraea typhae]